MKRKVVILVLLCVTFGCSKSNDSKTTDIDSFLNQLKSAPFVDISKENLPEWLVVRINAYYETRSPSICKVLIYQGEWGKQIVYFIMDTFSSCLCDFFFKDGERIVNNLSDCHATSKNWIIIYEYGELFLLNLHELYSN